MKQKIATIAILSLLISSVLLGFCLWRWSIPKLSYNVAKVPMNEMQDKERFEVVDEAFGRPALDFSQFLKIYRGAEDLLKLEIDIHRNEITITEIYDSKEAEEQICPYFLTGRIEPLRGGTYIIRVIFIDRHMNKTETLYEITVNFTVKPD